VRQEARKAGVRHAAVKSKCTRKLHGKTREITLGELNFWRVLPIRNHCAPAWRGCRLSASVVRAVFSDGSKGAFFYFSEAAPAGVRFLRGRFILIYINFDLFFSEFTRIQFQTFSKP
jgi:hypothetical protein